MTRAAQRAGGSKLSLAALQELLGAQRVDWSVLWEKIVEVVLACLYVVQVRCLYVVVCLYVNYVM